MKIENDNYTVTKKKSFIQNKDFKETTIEKVFESAYQSCFINKYETGGQYKGEIFIQEFQKKLAELGFYNAIYQADTKLYEKFTQYTEDFFKIDLNSPIIFNYNDLNIYMETSAYDIDLLMLSESVWDKDTTYIPNREKGINHFDYIFLTRIRENGETLLKNNNLLFNNEVNKQQLHDLILSQRWTYDIPGFITNHDLQSLINNQQFIPKDTQLNTTEKIKSNSFYVESANLKEFNQFVDIWLEPNIW